MLVKMCRVVLIAVISATAAGGSDEIEGGWQAEIDGAFMISDRCFGSYCIECLGRRSCCLQKILLEEHGQRVCDGVPRACGRLHGITCARGR